MTVALSQDVIVREALALLDEEGLDQLSLRRVASRLKVRAPSLYWHVANKADLLALVAETIFRGAFQSMPDCPTWQDWLRAFGIRLWRVHHSVRDVSRLILVARFSDRTLDRFSDLIVGTLVSMGLPAAEADICQAGVQAYATGWASLATGPNRPYVLTHFAVEDAFVAGLDALIRGFERRL